MTIRQALEKAASWDPKIIRDTLAETEFTNLTYPNPTVKFGPDWPEHQQSGGSRRVDEG